MQVFSAALWPAAVALGSHACGSMLFRSPAAGIELLFLLRSLSGAYSAWSSLSALVEEGCGF